MSDIGVDWEAVQSYLRRLPVVPTTILAGTSEWVALDDDDPQKMAALIVAGSRWVLEREIDQRTAHREAQKQAAEAISESLPWKQIATEIRNRDEAHRNGAYIKREAS